MTEIVKISKGQPFVLYVPLVILNGDGSKEAVDAGSLSNVSVKLLSACDELTTQHHTFGRYLVLELPATLNTGAYAVVITATLAQGRQFALRIKRAFEVVDWDGQSNWRDYLVGDHIELIDQPFIAGVFATDAYIERLKEELRQQKAEAAQAQAEAEAAKEEFNEKAEQLDDVAQESTLGEPPVGSDKTTVFQYLASILEAFAGIEIDIPDNIATKDNVTAAKQAILDALSHIDIDTSNLAKEATLEAVGLDAAAAKVAAQAITGYALQGSGNSTQTDIASAIGTPATGQPSTLFAAIAAGGGSTEILAKLQQIIDAHILGFDYDGLIFESGYTPNGVVDVIKNSGKLVEIHDSTGHTIYKITSSAYPKLQVYDMPNASSAGAEIFSSNVLREIIITNAQTLGNIPFYNCGALRYLDIQNSRPTYTYLFSDGATIGAGSPNLIRVKFGAGLTGSATFYQIATNAYSNVSNSLLTYEEKAEHPTWHNLDMFLYNIREHIVKNLPDRTGQQPYTLTLSQQTRNVLDQETEDAFAEKGWSLAPNKSV